MSYGDELLGRMRARLKAAQNEPYYSRVRHWTVDLAALIERVESLQLSISQRDRIIDNLNTVIDRLEEKTDDRRSE